MLHLNIDENEMPKMEFEAGKKEESGGCACRNTWMLNLWA